MARRLADAAADGDAGPAGGDGAPRPEGTY